MSKYIFVCTSCNSEFSKEKIENNLYYLCPNCGKAEINQPLHGVLKIQYDYTEVKKTLTREKLLKSQPGSIWNFPEILPLDFEKENLPSRVDKHKLKLLKLNSNPLHKLKYSKFTFYVFDDTKNPTFSFKDRASILVAMKAIQLGIKDISAASTGNAGSSIAGICTILGLNSKIFVPETIPEAKRIQIQSYGAEIFLVKGSYDDAFDLCLEVSKHKKWFNRNTAFNPFTIEGKKSAAYDIFISSQGNVPQNIIVPVGDGVILGGLYKGFTELVQLGLMEQLPCFIAVQSTGSNALVRFYKTKIFEFNEAYTIADSICATAPRNLFMANEALSKSNGLAIEVTDNEIIDAQKEIISSFGLFVEPSCSATFAAFKKLINENLLNYHEDYLLMFTGNGLKDLSSLKKWNYEPVAKTFKEWHKELINE